ncbi:MAG: M20/M25/M40 family metallo-hydrolase [Candidatus Acidiferrales bacterium]
MVRKISVLACTAAFLLVTVRPVASSTGSSNPPSPAEDGTLRALAAVAGAGTMETHSYEYLEELTDDIGARVTGSPAAARAADWGVEKMKSLGIENVHEETWQIRRGWTRGSAGAEIVAPIRRRLNVDSLGWAGSTPAGGVEATIVAVNAWDLENEVRENEANWRGKVILMVHRGPKPQNAAGAFAKFGAFLREARKAGAVAVIAGQGGSKAAGMNLTHTGALGFDEYFEIPVVSMTSEDEEQLDRFLDRGLAVRLKIDVQNRVTEHPVDSANVIGEIRGTEHAEQIVVVGGHLDSWDLATGATDNGVGSCATLGAAEAIVKSGYKPRRTIRFVLFTGEEEGLLGSIAYTKMHQSEMANHVAAVILDNGQGPVAGLQLGGRSDLVPAVEKFAEALQAFGPMRVDDEVEFGTDTGPFIMAGLPGINLDQDSPEYKFTHHSAADTFDKVRPDILERNSTIMALTAFWIADRPDRLATPWPAEKTARMLVAKHEDVELKLFNLWPFGDLGADAEQK